MSVLLVDDDPRNLDALEAILSPLGRTLVRATSGQEALRCCLEQDFVVIILDVRMPGFDGYQTAELIRTRERSRTTPIIFMTASTESEAEVIRGYEAGAVDYLRKPVEPHVIISKVRVFLELAARAEEITAHERRLRELEAREREREVDETTWRERNRADEAIQRVLERQSVILQSAPLVVYSAEPDPPYRLTWISDNVDRVLGFDAAILMAPGFWATRVHSDDLETVTRALGAIGDGQWHGTEFRWRFPDDAYRWFLMQVRLWRDVSSRQAELVGTTQDITDYHNAHEALRASEGQFRQAQKMEAVGRLAGGVAHDFNNLIAVVLGYGQLLLDSLAPDDQARADAEEIMKVGQRAAALTRQLLAFSRQQVLAPRVIDLNELVTGVRGLLRPLLGEDIELTLTLRAAPATLRADPGHLEQTIMNLAVNARDAMPDGGRIVIETDSIEAAGTLPGLLPALPAGSYVSLAVADTGCGMDEAMLGRIFEPFFTTKDVGKGTGLGLSTVYGIVQQMGGQLQVESAVGLGTTFRIFLPLAAGAADTAQPDNGDEQTSAGSETILLAEDETNLREICRSYLARLGYTVLAAEHGASALDLAAKHSGAIDLLVTDVMMPVMGGQELVEHLATARPGLKVLFMSGYTDRGITEADLGPGRAMLAKPFTPVSLASRVRELLRPVAMALIAIVWPVLALAQAAAPSATVTPPGTPDRGRPPRVVLDKASVRLDRIGGSSLAVTAGRHHLTIGSQFLIGDGVYDGFAIDTDQAVYHNPRRPGGLHGEVGYASPIGFRSSMPARRRPAQHRRSISSWPSATR